MVLPLKASFHKFAWYFIITPSFLKQHVSDAPASDTSTPDGRDYTIDHSAVIYVYDRSNRLRLITQPDFSIDGFAADLRRLARES